MRTLRRWLRIILGALSVGCVVAFLALALMYVREPFVGDLLAYWWICGIAALLSGVAACLVDAEASDAAGYLTSIVHGLRDEWRRQPR